MYELNYIIFLLQLHYIDVFLFHLTMSEWAVTSGQQEICIYFCCLESTVVMTSFLMLMWLFMHCALVTWDHTYQQHSVIHTASHVEYSVIIQHNRLYTMLTLVCGMTQCVWQLLLHVTRRVGLRSVSAAVFHHSSLPSSIPFSVTD